MDPNPLSFFYSTPREGEGIQQLSPEDDAVFVQDQAHLRATSFSPPIGSRAFEDAWNSRGRNYPSERSESPIDVLAAHHMRDVFSGGEVPFRNRHGHNASPLRSRSEDLRKTAPPYDTSPLESDMSNLSLGSASGRQESHSSAMAGFPSSLSFTSSPFDSLARSASPADHHFYGLGFESEATGAWPPGTHIGASDRYSPALGSAPHMPRPVSSHTVELYARSSASPPENDNLHIPQARSLSPRAHIPNSERVRVSSGRRYSFESTPRSASASPGFHGREPISGEHPSGEHPSRTLFVRNLDSSIEDSELKKMFEVYGPIRSMHTQSRNRGFVMIAFFDIRDAKSALSGLQGYEIKGRKMAIHYAIPKDNPSEKDQNQGTLVVFNLDPSIPNTELLEVFGEYGEIKEIRETPNKKHHKFIEFFDVRDAERAMKKLNKTELSGKKIKIEPSRPGGPRRPPPSSFPESGKPVYTPPGPYQPRSHVEGLSPLYGSGPPVGYGYGPYSETGPLMPEPRYPPGTSYAGYHQLRAKYAPQSYNPPPSQRGGTASSGVYGVSAPPGLFGGFPLRGSSMPTDPSGALGPRHHSSVLHQMSFPPASSPGGMPPLAHGGPQPPLSSTPSSRGSGGHSSPRFRNNGGSNTSGGGRGSRGRKNSKNSQFALDINKVKRGEENRTTLMIKNIPNKYSQKMLLDAVNNNHKGRYDFFYLPIDFKNKCNVGYAFINFIEPGYIPPFYDEFNDKKWEMFNSEKVCEIAWARIQGKEALVQHFQNSSLMTEEQACRPRIFYSSGPKVGQPEPFPVGRSTRKRHDNRGRRRDT